MNEQDPYQKLHVTKVKRKGSIHEQCAKKIIGSLFRNCRGKLLLKTNMIGQRIISKDC